MVSQAGQVHAWKLSQAAHPQITAGQTRLGNPVGNASMRNRSWAGSVRLVTSRGLRLEQIGVYTAGVWESLRSSPGVCVGVCRGSMSIAARRKRSRHGFSPVLRSRIGGKQTLSFACSEVVRFSKSCGVSGGGTSLFTSRLFSAVCTAAEPRTADRFLMSVLFCAAESYHAMQCAPINEPDDSSCLAYLPKKYNSYPDCVVHIWAYSAMRASRDCAKPSAFGGTVVLPPTTNWMFLAQRRDTVPPRGA